MKKHAMVVTLIAAVLVGTNAGHAQQWSLGGNVGLSLLGGAAGFHITPMAEMLFNRSMGVGTEFSINSQYGAPLIWYSYFKYYFNIRRTGVRPYANAGPVLTLNVPNAPCFGILFGGGVNIPIAHKLYITPDVQLGPVFGYGGATYPLVVTGYYWGYFTYGATSYSIPSVTVFTFSIRGGIRYEI